MNAPINSFSSAVAHYSANPQRDRLIRRLTEWANARPRYALKIGHSRVGFEALTDTALAELASSIAADVRWERQRNRENYARNAASFQLAAE